MQIVNPQRYRDLVDAAQSAAFTGWDFSWLAGRMIEDDPPWDYRTLVRSHMVTAKNLLDMGTGGGEFLAALAPLLPDTHTTECFSPNQSIAEARLTPLGVKVHRINEDDALPFDTATFDLVINRHEFYDPGEVYRILKPGGIFITQQVSDLDNLELNQVLEKTVPFPVTSWCLLMAVTDLVETGFKVELAAQASLKTQFMDIGAVVYYLKAITWQVEGFSVETHNEQLVRLHNFIERHGAFSTTAHRFLIIGHKEENQL